MSANFPEISDTDTNNGDDEDESIYLNEMTQDVIEWDESKSTDLCQIYRSPLPPGSRGITKRTTRSSKKKKRTPKSTSSTNSSLFLDVKRQLDPLCRHRIMSGNNNHVKSNININNNNYYHDSSNNNNHDNNHSNSNNIRIKKAEIEIDGILDVLNMEGTVRTANNQINGAKYSFSSQSSINSMMPTPKRQNNKRPAKGQLKRHHTHPKTHHQNQNQRLKTSATTLALRHRRRRTEYAQNDKLGQQRKEQSANIIRCKTLPSTTAFTTPVVSSLSNVSGRNIESMASVRDDFAVLLDAITTPNLITKIRSSRSPLASVDENTTKATTTNEKVEIEEISFCTKTAEETSTGAVRKSHNAVILDRSMKSVISPQVPAASEFQSNRFRVPIVVSKEPSVYSKCQEELSYTIPPSTKHHRQIQPITSSKIQDSDTSIRVCNRLTDTIHAKSHNKDDEFGDIEFSEDDIATIDSLTAPQFNICQPTTLFYPKNPRENINQFPSKSPVTNIDQSDNTNSDKILSSLAMNQTEDTSSIRGASDEYGDFPSDSDFAEIDAIILTQSCQPNTTIIAAKDVTTIPMNNRTNEQDEHTVPEEEDEFRYLPIETATQCGITESSISAFPMTGQMDDSKSDKVSLPTEEDEFGSFPDDIDFNALDEVVTQRLATQCDLTKFDDSNPSIKPFTVTGQMHNSKSYDAPSPTTEDEFGSFPDDIDFNALDEVITQRLISQPNIGANTRGDETVKQRDVKSDINTVRNLKMNTPKCGELSFMKFSRYKVMAVDDDKKNNIKTVTVAAWNTSMMKLDDQERKFHEDCKVYKSGCKHLDKEDRSTLNLARDTKDGLINLCGEWYHTPIEMGDLIHVCSLTGRYQTDVTALPITLHTFPALGSDIDDLILVLHPDMLMTPSTISETSSCNRRAVLKSKIGSEGIASKPAFVGTMRHALFEACMKTAEFDKVFAQRVTKNLIREKAETLIGCNVSEAEIEDEVLNVLPMIQKFAGEYTTLRKDVIILDPTSKPVGGAALHPDIRLLGKGVHSVEESIVSTELGLKGAIDAILETESTIIGHKHNNNISSNNAACYTSTSSPQQSLMCFELKTGHNQNAQLGHMAQLSLYTIMLQSRYGAHVRLDGNRIIGSQSEMESRQKGAAPGGILLYLNHQSQKINHVSPHLGEIKTLMSQRNVVASGLKKSSSPRGIALSYAEGPREDDDQNATARSPLAPPANLPELTNPYSCKRCFSNRECMLYAASGSATDVTGHHELLSQFTGHLKEVDLAYFRKWDRLIDIEADASKSKDSVAWLIDSRLREIDNGESISGLFFDAHASYEIEHFRALICFRRKAEAYSQSSLNNLNLSPGSYVIVSTDGTLFDDFTRTTDTTRKFRHRMHITKGYIDRIEDDRVFVSSTCDELDQMKVLVNRHQGTQHSDGGIILCESLLFRLDKNKTVGTGILRWNLINFLTGGYKSGTGKDYTQLDRIKQLRLSRLRDIVIRLKNPEFVNELRNSIFNGIGHQVSGCNLLVLKDEFSQLNNDQQEAVRMAISGSDYTLIQGLPGTGKTSTVTFLARLFMAQGRRVLITAYTHSAVDNIMLKLIEKGMGSRNSKSGASNLVRLGNGRSCHESVKTILHLELAREMDKISENRDDSPHQQSRSGKTYGYIEHPSAVSLKGVITNARIVGVTALSLPRSPLLQHEVFDLVIIDEAGQMNEPATLGAISCADKFILVGDHKQLPPLVNSVIAENGGYGTSVLKRLADEHPHAIALLTMQYRMNKAICQISSESMYGGLLKCGDEKTKLQLLKLPGYPSLLPKPCSQSCSSWLHSVVDPQRPVIFVDTDNICNPRDSTTKDEKFEFLEGKIGGKGGGSIVNRTEAILVRYILKALHLCGHELSNIGVISPFRAQIRVLEESSTVLSWKKKGLELSTIDKFQGRDKSTIVLSLVRSNERNIVGRLLQDERRLNVALTRAKKKLIILGSFKTLKNSSTRLKPILDQIDARNQRFLLPDNAVECYIMP